MMHHLRVPTQEPYAYLETDFEGSAEDAVTLYREITQMIQYGDGMEEKQFNEIIDLMIGREPIQLDPGELDKMNKAQRYLFDGVRKSIGRIKYKNR